MYRVAGIEQYRYCTDASTEQESIKNSQKLTAAALEISNVAKDDKDNEETAEIKKEDGGDLPIRDTPKESKTTPGERKAEDGVDVAELQKEAVACHLRIMYFNIASKTRIPFP